jgi:hypothetical protein
MIVWQLSIWQNRGKCEMMIRGIKWAFIPELARRRYKKGNQLAYCVIRRRISSENIPEEFALNVNEEDIIKQTKGEHLTAT